MERQKEVDHILEKARLEMYVSVQAGGHSSKALNGSTGTLPSKPSTNSVQNSSSFPSHVKGKKRERGDKGSDHVKRERSLKADSARFGPEQMLKTEIAKITNRGGLVDIEGVEKLVQLMLPETADRKIDLACRIMLADVIAVTDSFDCLRQFVLLKGLPVLDEWLREVQKGKIGDGSTSKECDQSIDNFLFALLRALDKLPVNLRALQTCNVGKSVNHLRTHKNSEIQKKARSLVDSWKKRVEAEINVIDAKSGSSCGGSWPTKLVISEVSNVGSCQNGGSSEAGVNTSIVQSSASQTTPVRLGSGELVAKCLTTSLGSTQLPAAVTTTGVSSTWDPISATLGFGGTSDLLLTTMKEEKSSNSSQSQSNSQSCSSDHAKTGASSCREDARCSTAEPASVHKISSGSIGSQKLSNSIYASGTLVVQKESSTANFGFLQRNMTSERLSPSRVSCKRAAEVPPADNGNSQPLIVRLPNTGCSPARNSSGGSPEGFSSTFHKASPPAHSDKLDHHDRLVKVKSDGLLSTSVSNTSMHLSQSRDVLHSPWDVNSSSADSLCDELYRDGEDGEKLMGASKGTGLSSRVPPKPGRSYDDSFSSINALIESCAKFSEASPSASGGDDIGMNLLASVAAGEISRADVPLSGSPGRKSLAQEKSCSGNDVKLRPLVEDKNGSENESNGGRNGGAIVEQCNSVDPLGSLLPANRPPVTNLSKDCKGNSFDCEEKTGECAAQLNSSNMTLPHKADGPVLSSDGKVCNLICNSSVDITKEGNLESELVDQFHERRKSVAREAKRKSTSNSKLKLGSPLFSVGENVGYAYEKDTENSLVGAPEAASASAKVENGVNEAAPFSLSSEIPGENKNAEMRQADNCNLAEQKPLRRTGGKNDHTAPPPASCKTDDTEVASTTVMGEKETLDICPLAVDHDSECAQNDMEKETLEIGPSAVDHSDKEPPIPVNDTEECMKDGGCPYDVVDTNGAEDLAARTNPSISGESGSGTGVKLDFDLNEGFLADDGSQGEYVNSLVPGNSASTHLPCPLPIPLSSVTGNSSSSITVAAAAIGSFVPPETPLRSKGELGWRGSAATSAFRPAEPRKVVEMPLKITDVTHVEKSFSKQGRPFFDFDLNVPDERVLDDLASQNSGQATCSQDGYRDRSSGGLDLDLNRADESAEIGHPFLTNTCRFEIPQIHGRSPLAFGISNPESNAAKGFDLNDGPGLDEGATETALHAKTSMQLLPTLPAMRMNKTEPGNFSSWFPPSNSYSAISFPSVLSGRGEQGYPLAPGSGSQKILTPPTDSRPSLNPEIYRGPVLSSSPATLFQNPGFPFETHSSFSSSSYSTCSTAYVDSSSGGPLYFHNIPNIPSQLVGPTGVGSAHYTRSYALSLPGSSSNACLESRNFASQGLDLNAGPGGVDVERRDGRLPPSLRQFPVTGSQVLADEQLKLYQMASGVLKRKEPDGGWDGR